MDIIGVETVQDQAHGRHPLRGGPMPTRRGIVLSGLGLAATVATSALGGGTTSSPTIQTPVDFAMPDDAVDSHVHVFDPTAYPYAPNRSYTPPPATVDDLRALHRGLRVRRTVIVTSTVYGTDNAATLDAIGRLGNEQARGVALIDAGTDRDALGKLDAGGIRAVRVFLGLTADVDVSDAARRLTATEQQIDGLRWHLQTYARLPVLSKLRSRLATVSVPLVLDHFAGVDAAAGIEQPGFQDILELVRSGRVYVKLSGAYYSSKKAPDFSDIAPFARAFVAANPERVLWGSDFPHPNSAASPNRKATDVAPPQAIDDGSILSQLARWVPDAGARRMILVDNPNRLFDFR